MKTEHAMVDSTRRCLNRDVIKYIAMVTMLLNHIANIFLESGTLLCELFLAVGYFTAPVMVYFLVEGYAYTHSKKTLFFAAAAVCGSEFFGRDVEFSADRKPVICCPHRSRRRAGGHLYCIFLQWQADGGGTRLRKVVFLPVLSGASACAGNDPARNISGRDVRRQPLLFRVC